MNTRMKLIMFLILSISVVVMQAQPKPPSKDETLNQLVKQLGLNDKQKDKVSTILDAVHKKLDALKPGSGSKGRPSMEEMEEVFKYQDKEIEKILTSDQKKKFAEIVKDRKNRRPSRDERPPEPPGGFHQ